jgi:hypothetical protein
VIGKLKSVASRSGAPYGDSLVHSGQEGLALPEITVQSTDAQVADMQKALGPARQQVQQSRHALAEDAIRVIRLAENA